MTRVHTLRTPPMYIAGVQKYQLIDRTPNKDASDLFLLGRPYLDVLATGSVDAKVMT
jgi:hypothetical protein